MDFFFWGGGGEGDWEGERYCEKLRPDVGNPCQEALLDMLEDWVVYNGPEECICVCACGRGVEGAGEGRGTVKTGGRL